MSQLPLIEQAAASDEVQAIYNDFRMRMGFSTAPNFFKSLGASLVSVRGVWALVRNLLLEGVLPRTLKEMIVVAISNDRNCRYCEAVHLAFCRMLGIELRTMELLVTDIDEVESEAVRETLRFALKCSQTPQSLTAEDFSRLRRQGFSDSEITEIVAVASMAVFCNIISDAMGVIPDEMFGAE